MDICTRSVPRLRTRPSVRGLSFALYRLRRQSVRGMSHISARGHLHAVCPPCALRRQSVRGLSHISVRGHLHAVRPTCSARALPISSPTSLHVAICTRSVPYLMLCTRFTRALSNQLTLSHGSPHTHSCRRLYVCPPSQFSCLPSLSNLIGVWPREPPLHVDLLCHDGTLPRLTPVLANALRRRGSLLIDSAQHTRQHYSYI